jgi:prolyl 4-hydroxylase
MNITNHTRTASRSYDTILQKHMCRIWTICPTAVRILIFKRLCFSVRPYKNETVPHPFFLHSPPATESYDYDSQGKGGNRFATILLYMSDLPDDAGGETVFLKAPGKGDISKKDAIKEMRAAGELELITLGSWEENMLGDCRTRLATRPRASRAVLFYSQRPDGQEDLTSTHGGCPVLKGTK